MEVLGVRVEESCGDDGVWDWREIGVCWRAAIGQLGGSLSHSHSHSRFDDGKKEFVELKGSGCLEVLGID